MSMLRPSNRSNCCFLTCIQISQEAGKVFLYSHLIKNFPQFVAIYTVKGFGAINKAESEVKVKSLSHVQFFMTPWTVAYQASPSMGFSRQEYWIGCHFLLHVFIKYKMTSQGKCNNTQILFQYLSIFIFAYSAHSNLLTILKYRHYYYFHITDERKNLCH